MREYSIPKDMEGTTGVVEEELVSLMAAVEGEEGEEVEEGGAAL